MKISAYNGHSTLRTHDDALIAKTSLKKDDLRSDRWRKTQCGAAYFGAKRFKKLGAMENVDYKVVTSASELP